MKDDRANRAYKANKAIRLKGYETEDTLEGRDEGGPDEGVQGLDR